MPNNLERGTAFPPAWILTPPTLPSLAHTNMPVSSQPTARTQNRLSPWANVSEIDPSSQKRWPHLFKKIMHAPTANALKSMVSDDSVTIQESKPWTVFKPTDSTDKGLIFYPGALVDGRAYAKLARGLAKQGYQVVIINMPMSFSPLAPDRAERAMAAFPKIKNWAIGGHSLGGLTAAYYANKHPNLIQALICYGSFPATNMSKSMLKTIVILGSKDSLVKQWDFLNYECLLPETAQVHTIEGGNHSNFGDYGLQWGDQVADISLNEQQNLIVRYTTDFLKLALAEELR